MKDEKRLLESLRKFILEELRITIIDVTERRCLKRTRDEGLVAGAHAIAFFQAMLATLLYGRKLRGQFKEVKNHFAIEKHHAAVRAAVEDAGVVISETLSGMDPEFDYQVQILRKPKMRK